MLLIAIIYICYRDDRRLSKCTLQGREWLIYINIKYIILNVKLTVASSLVAVAIIGLVLLFTLVLVPDRAQMPPGGSTVRFSIGFPAMAPHSYRVAKVQIASRPGPVSYLVEVADTPVKADQGLMYRPSLAAGAGMLFVFDGNDYRYFWMKDTPVPLDLVYISGRLVVVGVRENAVPYSVECIPPPGPCRYVLEINAGQCAEHGIKAGDRVRISAGA